MWRTIESLVPEFIEEVLLGYDDDALSYEKLETGYALSSPDFSPDFVARSRKRGCGKECGAIRP